MAALRATSFYIGVPSPAPAVDTWTVVATVPAGKRWILKNVHIYNADGVTRTTSVRIDGAIQILTPNVAAAGFFDQNLYLVLNAGQTLGAFQRAGGHVNYELSGYELYV